MNVRFGALAFVVGVRLVYSGVGFAIGVPVGMLKRRLPSTDGPIFPRLARLRDWLTKSAEKHLPPWVDHRGSGTLMLKSDYGMGRLDALVDRIPMSIIAKWRRFGILTMEFFLFMWGVVLLGMLAATGWAVSKAAVMIFEWAIAYDWIAFIQSLLQPHAPPEYDLFAMLVRAIEVIPQLITIIAGLVVAFLAALVLWWAILLPLLPGVALHEFGHYAAIRKAGASVDSYGLLLWGPFLAGAFVNPGDDAESLNTEDTFAAWSGGIANSVLWGIILIAVGLTMGGDATTVFRAFFNHGLTALMKRPFASLVILVGGIEVANGFLNAVPVGPVDGGGFIRTVEREWWGFDHPADDFSSASVSGSDGGDRSDG